MSKYMLYINAFKDVINARMKDEGNKKLIKQNVYYGVKIVNRFQKPDDRNEAVNNFEFISIIKQVMGLLTPKEFMNIFPIEKDFEGYKYGMKDYFYTKKYISGLDEDKPIGEDILYFLMEYTNKEIEKFTIKSMECMSDIRRFEGKPSLAEEWANDNGIKTYKLHKDSKGNQFLLDKQGRTKKVSKARPKHLKSV